LISSSNNRVVPLGLSIVVVLLEKLQWRKK
jgi:hypothetical protein